MSTSSRKSSQVAYVVDPIRQTRGFFQWRDRKSVEPVSGFHVVGRRRDRVALARFVSDLESLPSAAPASGFASGALSPRLEAQLIAMLNRPPVQHSPGISNSASGGGPWPLLFGLLGVILGGLAVAGVLALGSLGRQLQDQNSALEKLQGVVSQRIDEPMAERLAAKEQAPRHPPGCCRTGR